MLAREGRHNVVFFIFKAADHTPERAQMFATSVKKRNWQSAHRSSSKHLTLQCWFLFARFVSENHRRNS